MSDALFGMSTNFWIIIGAALVTYATRFGGHMVLSRFSRIPQRVSVALDAIPAAVLTTLVAPAAFSNGPAEIITLAVVLVAGYRMPMMAMFILGWGVIVALRAAGL